MLDKLVSPKISKRKVQVGRGIGSGHGAHTTGRGTKGQKSRSGYSRVRRGFEGGQMPLSRRLPNLRGQSRGNRNKPNYATHGLKHYTIKISEIENNIDGNLVNLETLVEAGMLRTFSKKLSLKIVLDQAPTKALEVSGVPVSKTAKEAIEKAGGKVE